MTGKSYVIGTWEVLSQGWTAPRGTDPGGPQGSTWPCPAPVSTEVYIADCTYCAPAQQRIWFPSTMGEVDYLMKRISVIMFVRETQTSMRQLLTKTIRLTSSVNVTSHWSKEKTNISVTIQAKKDRLLPKRVNTRANYTVELVNNKVEYSDDEVGGRRQQQPSALYITTNLLSPLLRPTIITTQHTTTNNIALPLHSPQPSSKFLDHNTTTWQKGYKTHHHNHASNRNSPTQLHTLYNPQWLFHNSLVLTQKSSFLLTTQCHPHTTDPRPKTHYHLIINYHYQTIHHTTTTCLPATNHHLPTTDNHPPHPLRPLHQPHHDLLISGDIQGPQSLLVTNYYNQPITIKP